MLEGTGRGGLAMIWNDEFEIEIWAPTIPL